MPKVYNLWIIRRDSGVCLVDASIGDLPPEIELAGQLMSGLFTALNTFTLELFNEEIRLFETENYRLMFSVDEKFFIVLLFEGRISKKIVLRVLEKIQDLIKLKFPVILDDSFDGDITGFQEMEKEFEKIAELKGLKLIQHAHKRRKELSLLNKVKKIEDSFKNMRSKSN